MTTIYRPRRILLVEDEYFIADDLRKMLDEAGAVVVGPVATEADALAVIEDMPVDCAILDINLRGTMVYSLARALRRRDVPFLFVTGYDTAEHPAEFDDIALIRKPFAGRAVLEGVERLIDLRRKVATTYRKM